MQDDPFLGMCARAETTETSDFLSITFFIMTRRLCRHLEKLDALPLDERFDFQVFFGCKEFLYLGKSSSGSALWTDLA